MSFPVTRFSTYIRPVGVDISYRNSLVDFANLSWKLTQKRVNFYVNASHFLIQIVCTHLLEHISMVLKAITADNIMVSKKPECAYLKCKPYYGNREDGFL